MYVDKCEINHINKSGPKQAKSQQIVVKAPQRANLLYCLQSLLGEIQVVCKRFILSNI